MRPRLLEYRVDYETLDHKVELFFDFMEEDLAKRLKAVKRFNPITTKVIVRICRTL